MSDRKFTPRPEVPPDKSEPLFRPRTSTTPVETGKHFRPRTSQTTEGHRFRSRKSIESSPEEVTWFQQPNGYDCGPCLLLNATQFLGVPNEESVEHIRGRINEMRERGGESPLGQTEWILSSDINIYLNQKGFRIAESFASDPNSEEKNARNFERARRFIREGNWRLIYSSQGSHFRGIVKIPQEGNTYQYMLLDSFQTGPREVSEEQVIEFARSAIQTRGRQTVLLAFN